MEHIATKDTVKPVSEAILETQRARLERRREELAIRLAGIAEELARIDMQITNPEFSRTKLTLELEWYRYDNDTYVSGYMPDSRYRVTAYEINTYDAVTAWLGVLATQPKPLAELPSASKDARELSATLSSVVCSTTDMPESAARNVFHSARSSALVQVQEVLLQISKNNPYRNIPIPIDEAALHDALARERILQYCLERDPGFVISRL